MMKLGNIISESLVILTQRRMCCASGQDPSLRSRMTALALVTLWALPASAVDVSEPAILQMFEAKWDTIEDRMADIFEVGYGQMWLPPPQRADGGSLSVGYDLFDRFDLGRPRNETLYGTETALKTSIAAGPWRERQDVHRLHSQPQRLPQQEHVRFRGARRLSRICALDIAATRYGDFHDPSISYHDRTRSTAACSA